MKTNPLDSISSNSKGIPDCWHIDVNGKSSHEVFNRYFGVPRKYRHGRKGLGLALDRKIRTWTFFSALIHYRHLSSSILLAGDPMVSPEAHALARFDEGWHLRRQEELQEVAKLSEVDREQMLASLRETRQSPAWQHNQTKVQALANRDNITIDQVVEVMLSCALESWLRAREALKNWRDSDQDTRQVLAEAIFCGFTMFGKRALEEAAAIEPAILEYYRSFLGIARGTGSDPAEASEPIVPIDFGAEAKLTPEMAVAPSSLVAAATLAPKDPLEEAARQWNEDGESHVEAAHESIESTVPPVGRESDDAPTSFRELYGLIGRISLNAYDDPTVGPDPALRIQALLEQHVQRLSEINARLSADEVVRLMERYCSALLQITAVLDFEHSDQRELVPVLHTAWMDAVASALQEGRPRVWFEVNLQDRRELPELIERFEVQNQKIGRASDEIEAIRTQLAEAKYTARTALKASEARKQSEIGAAEGELNTLRVEAAHYLAPEGRTLDDLMEGVDFRDQAQFNHDRFDLSAVRSLQAVVQCLDSCEIGEATESLAGSSRGEATRSAVTTTIATNSAEAAQVAAQERLPAPVEPATAITADFPVTASDSAVTEPVTVISGEEEPAEELINVSASDGVEAALCHLQPADSKEEAQTAFRIAYDQFSQVPSNVVEAVALHWLDAGHINVAYRILRDAKDTPLVTGRVLDAALLRSAYYGMNLWPKDSEALSHTQRELNLVNYRELEEQLERKPSGKLVPYLLVCSALQPALFAGRETQAPSMLRVAADHFGGAINQLILNVAEFTQRGGRVDLDVLRDEAGQETHLTATRLQDEVRSWVDLNANRTTRWQPLRVALKRSMQRQIFADAIQAIERGEKGDVAAVRQFISTYGDHGETRNLLDELVQEIRGDYTGPSDQIDSHAYAVFLQQVDSLISIAQSWLLEVAPSEIHEKDVGEFVKRFRTQLDRSIATLMAYSGRNGDLEHRAGSTLLLKALSTLQAEIKGDGPPTWRFEQTDATFQLPAVLARLDIGEVGLDYRLEWFATYMTSPNWLGDMIELAKRRNAHWVHLLLLRQLEASGDRREDIEVVSAKIAGTRVDLTKAIEDFKSLSIQAMSDDVTLSDDAIAEEEHLANMLRASEWLEKIKGYKFFVDTSPIEDEVKRLTRDLDKQLSRMARALEEELSQGLLDLRTRLGTEAVPESWEARARAALEQRKLMVVRELVNQLQDHLNRNARLTAYTNQDNADLANFLMVEQPLYSLLQQHPNPREAGERIIQERPGNFEYSGVRATFKDTIETMLEWRSRSQNRKPNLEKRTYEGLVQVLEFIGFIPIEKNGNADVLRSCEYSTTGDFRRMKVRVQRPTLPKGFPIFEGDHSKDVSLNVIFVQGAFSLNGLVDLVERHGLPAKAVLLVGSPLSPDDRHAFSTFCRDRKYTVFLVDPVVVAYLATLPNHETLRGLLHVTAAWTFYNPYTKGDARQPAPPEMRFGREHDVASLVEPRGAALVYGGRQLGKTTLLHSAVQKFNQMDPVRNRAFYLRMDGLFQHAVERGTDVKARVFELLVNQLDEAGLLSTSTRGKSAEERLQAEFQRNGETRVLFCLDEIDSVLDRDARTKFELVRSLAALVNDPHQRFRVVFAGLNNVNRFHTMPNVPLEQLGSPLQVKILPAAGARSLILHPLTALGYSFEDEGQIDRIMAFTNCHPSLLHIFCSELVEQMALDRSVKDHSRVIRQTDLDSIESNSDVRRLSGDRFDMTLNLDLRYTVAVYGLINHYGKGVGKFTAKQALDVARKLVPEEFEQMSEAGFESLLQELEGLGVLRQSDRTLHQYAMRNQSILQLVGTPKDIAHKLQVAVRDLADHAENVLTCHVAAASQVPSPLSLQDEREILRAKSPEGASKYSVTVVMGSSALGLSIRSIQDGFKAIDDFRSGNAMARYETKPVTEAQLEPKRFQELLKTAITSWAVSNATVLLVALDEAQSIDRIMDLMSIANETASQATMLKHELRIVFLLGPHAMWSWYSHPWITSSPQEIGGLVELNRWTRHACQCLLDQLGLDVTPEQAGLLHAASEGWYLSLLKFIEVRKKKERARVSSFNDFARDFPPMTSLLVKDLDKFVEHTGMTSQVWSMPLAIRLKDFDSLNEFSADDLQTAIEFLDGDFHSHISPEQAASVVRWWAGLRVIEANTKETSRKAGKGDVVTYRFTPALQKAIAERSSPIATSKEGRV
ncbi:hypothetical protein [Burkholderia gladioli]|uniref:hypothetical protein n=1 Tax=Burkholderia gladioli TaxID=28095 RepID=UPI00163FB3A3|nr:hypothetical protein [Burkholderia gladioli]